MGISDLINKHESPKSADETFMQEPIDVRKPEPVVQQVTQQEQPTAAAPQKWVQPAPWEDPRDDLTEDSAVYTKLLRIAFDIDYDLCGILNGARCMATRLKRGNASWLLRPDIDETGRTAWNSQEEYDAFKAEHLTRFIENGQLKEAITKLNKEIPPRGY